MSDTLEGYLTALASKAPTPGGGSAATIAGAMAAALVAMVARITADNPSFSSVASAASSLVLESDDVRERLLAARHADEAAYGRVVIAMALPSVADSEKALRRDAVQGALAEAAGAPLHAAALALETLRLAQRASELRNTHLQSDVDCAIVFSRASIAASALNVRINHAFLKDRVLIDSQESALRAIETAASL